MADALETLKEIASNQPAWKVVLYMALQCRVAYLNLLAQLPGNSLETFPTPKVKKLLNEVPKGKDERQELRFFDRFTPADFDKRQNQISRHTSSFNRTLNAYSRFSSALNNVPGNPIINFIPLASSSLKDYIDKIRCIGQNPENIINNNVFKNYSALMILARDWVDEINDDDAGRVCPYDFGIRLTISGVELYYMFGKANKLYASYSEAEVPDEICDLTSPNAVKEIEKFVKESGLDDLLTVKFTLRNN